MSKILNVYLMFLKNHLSKLIIFISGCSVMILEITGVRIFGPVFGTTATVWTAIIGVFLGALTVGYYAGGFLVQKANKNPFILSAILVLAAGSVILILPFKSQINDFPQLVSYELRSLALSFMFFALPAFLLGIITTYVIGLQAENYDNFGSVNGVLYGFSTFGSLVGVFLSGFYLIPNFRISSIIFGVGIALLATAVFAAALHRRRVN